MQQQRSSIHPMQQEQHEVLPVAILPLVGMLIDALPGIIKAGTSIFESLRALGLSDDEIRARIAEKEAQFPGIIVYWESYTAKRHPGDK